MPREALLGRYLQAKRCAAGAPPGALMRLSLTRRCRRHGRVQPTEGELRGIVDDVCARDLLRRAIARGDNASEEQASDTAG